MISGLQTATKPLRSKTIEVAHNYPGSPDRNCIDRNGSPPITSAIGTPMGHHTVSEPPMKQFTVWVDRVCEPYGVSPFDTETQAREYIKTYRSRLR